MAQAAGTSSGGYDGECAVPNCGRRAVVFLAGRPLCAGHYVENVNELNDLGLTPGNLARDEGPDPRPSGPVRISEDVRSGSDERSGKPSAE